MRWKCPECTKVIESNYITDQVMKEIFKHEKTHRKHK